MPGGGEHRGGLNRFKPRAAKKPSLPPQKGPDFVCFQSDSTSQTVFAPATLQLTEQNKTVVHGRPQCTHAYPIPSSHAKTTAASLHGRKRRHCAQCGSAHMMALRKRRCTYT